MRYVWPLSAIAQARSARRLIPCLLVLVLLGALLPVVRPVTIAYADDPNFAFPFNLAGSSGNDTISAALGDVNGDGAADLVLANYDAPSQIFLNKHDGTGGFLAPVSLSGSQNNATSVALGDLDGDGALDIVLANDSHLSQVFLNKRDGTGTFKAPTVLNFPGLPPNTGLNTTSVVLGDLNGDGKLDIVLGNYGLPSMVYQNIGAGNFALAAYFPADGATHHNTFSVALGDLNSDGKLDVVLGNFGQASQVYLNTTNAGGAISFGAPTDLVGSGRRTVGVALGDLNGDGKLDIVLANNTDPNNGQPISQPTQLFLNTPASPGSFTTSSDLVGSGMGYTFAAALRDVNGDGALDVLLGNNGKLSQVYLNTNDGTGSFVVPTNLPGSANATQALALGDLNGDGTSDLVLGNSQTPSQVYLSSRPGSFITPTFAFPTVLAGSSSTQSVALGDLNGDGVLDIVLANTGVIDQDPNNTNNQIFRPILSQIYLGKRDRSGAFSPPFDLPGSGLASRAVALADLNGDGALDIVLGNGGATLNGQFVPQASQIFLNKNDGSGTFLPPTDIANSAGPLLALALGDLDGNGQADIVLGYRGQPAQILLNDPAHPGGFGAPIAVPGSNTDTISIALGDLNGDGKLDIVLCNYLSQPSQVYINTTAGGSFSLGNPVALLDSGKASDGVALGDFNGDGLLDLVLANFGQTSQVYFNTPASPGAFTTTAPVSLAGSDGKGISVGVGDMNGDGALDIVLGNFQGQLSQVFLNSGSGAFAPPLALAGSGKNSTRLALGDMNSDGALDVVLGNDDLPSQVFLNAGVSGLAAPAALAGSGSNTFGVAVGDLNNDGTLDLVLGNKDQPSQLFLNKHDGSGAFNLPSTLAGSGGDTRSVAVGDLNGDGLLDLVLGNFSQPSQISLNTPAAPGSFGAPSTLAGSGSHTVGVALGDLNGDGALDLVFANSNDPAQVFLNNNDGSGGFRAPVSLPGSGQQGAAVALGDLNGDGLLDIVFGDYGKPSQIYLNNGSGDPASFAATTLVGSGRQTQGIVLGDLNGDGATDIVASNFGQPAQVFLGTGDGAGNFKPPVDIAGSGNQSNRPALGDLNGDGALDLVLTSSSDQPAAAYLNRNDGSGNLYPPIIIPGSGGGTPSSLSGSGGSTLGVVMGDLNGDGALDVVLATGVGRLGTGGQLGLVYLNHHARAALLPDNPPTISIARPGPTGDADFYSTPVVLSDPVIPLTYHLFDRDGDPVRAISVTFSLDGGDHWRPAIAATGTITRDLATVGGANCSSLGCAYAFNWDTFASGVFGHSDNVVVRILAHPGTYARPNRVTGPYQRPYASATTFPFRVRGTQIQVMQDGRPAAGAIVYRLPADQSDDARPIASGSSAPFVTDAQGYLQGRGEIGVGDQLIALLPISTTDVYSSSYTLYHTNIVTTTTGVNGFVVTERGVQQITVAAAHPLLLFKLDISLEWDARKDTNFMAQLRHDLARTSEFLFSWSNGQVALGQVRIFQNKQWWDAVDMRIYASNRVRPNAVIGGLTSQPISDTLASDIAYAPGQVRMGAVWSRFGNASTSLSEDWPRTLAHELGHYALFLDDNYVGTDRHGQLISISSCPGVMSDPYANLSKFHPDADWLPGCAETLSDRSTGRSDWATIKTFYPTLIAPITSIDAIPPGPDRLPLAVTQIVASDPVTPSTTLDVPIFYTVNQDGSRYQPGLSARGYLFQNDGADPSQPPTRLTALGRTNLDQILARGAHVGDRVCVYEPANGRLGCETIKPGDEKVTLVAAPNWHPDVIMTPVTSRTLALTVSGVPADAAGPDLAAQIFPAELPASAPIALTAVGNGVYSGTFTLAEPVAEAYVQVWVREPEPRREVVTSFAVGGNPGYIRSGGGYIRSGGGYIRSGGGYIRSGGGYIRSGGGYIRSGGAPVSSAEGDVLLVGEHLTFAVGQFLALQTTSSLPTPPIWTTVIGNAYRFTASPNAPDLSDTSLSFNYLGSEVPPGEEPGIKVYFWDGTTWQVLPTLLDTYQNTASVRNRGPGLYALMSSIDIPLAGPGWNLFAYPVQATRPVSESLSSINGNYAAVYSYVLTDTLDPWKLYSPLVPDWVNDLHNLEFGRGYWINITSTNGITLSLLGSTGQQLQRAQTASLPNPPATFYGSVLPGNGFVPSAGMPVVALVDGIVCGRGQTRLIDGRVTYVVDVSSDGDSTAGCGAIGRTITFQVGSQLMANRIAWDGSNIHELALQSASTGQQRQQIYLPLIIK